jgi:hypothetical protein
MPGHCQRRPRVARALDALRDVFSTAAVPRPALDLLPPTRLVWIGVASRRLPATVAHDLAPCSLSGFQRAKAADLFTGLEQMPLPVSGHVLSEALDREFQIGQNLPVRVTLHHLTFCRDPSDAHARVVGARSASKP